MRCTVGCQQGHFQKGRRGHVAGNCPVLPRHTSAWCVFKDTLEGRPLHEGGSPYAGDQDPCLRSGVQSEVVRHQETNRAPIVIAWGMVTLKEACFEGAFSRVRSRGIPLLERKRGSLNTSEFMERSSNGRNNVELVLNAPRCLDADGGPALGTATATPSVCEERQVAVGA